MKNSFKRRPRNDEDPAGLVVVFNFRNLPHCNGEKPCLLEG